MKKRVLITGGAGFIGSVLASACVEAGYQVTIIDNLSTGRLERIPDEAEFYNLDILDPEVVEVFLKDQTDTVFHLAAQVSVPRSLASPVNDAVQNVAGTIAILEACRKSGVRKVVFSSTAAVYGIPQRLPIFETHPLQPLSPYGVSKRACESYLHLYKGLYGLDYTILRYANVYGPGQYAGGECGVLSAFMHRLASGASVKIFGDGEQTRDFVFVNDIARANLLAAKGPSGLTVNISTGVAVSVLDLVAILEEQLGAPIELEFENERPGDIRYSCLNSDAAGQQIGWQPQITLSEGIRMTFEALRNARESVS